LLVTKRHVFFELGPGKHILCNGITGEALIVTDTVIRSLLAVKENHLENSDYHALGLLAAHRFLFPSEQADDAAFLAACLPKWEDYLAHGPREYSLVLNTYCNFNCTYCFESPSLRAVRQTLTKEQIDAALRVIDDHLRECRSDELPAINIYGGEPLLPSSRPILAYFLGRLGGRGLPASIHSNGYHLAGFVPLFREHQDSISEIQITLDGPGVFHDARRTLLGGGPTFDRIVRGIAAIVEAAPPIRVHIRLNVDRRNCDALWPFAEFCERNGWTANSRFQITAAPVDNRLGLLAEPMLLEQHDAFRRIFPLSTDTGNGPFCLDNFKPVTYFRALFRNVHAPNGDHLTFEPRLVRCAAAALKYFVFHPDGRVYPCPQLAGVVPLAIGTYDPVLALDPAKTALWKDKSVMNRQECHECPISTFCGGGCIAGSLVRFGSTHAAFCESGNELIRAYFEQIRNAYQACNSDEPPCPTA
jgi:uncharacterized protein